MMPLGGVAIVVTDSSVLVNFLRVDRMDLIGRCSREFILTDHVRQEISDHYSEQQERLQRALAAGYVAECTIVDENELQLFGQLSASGQLGAGECSAIAVAIHRRHSLAIDDKLAIRRAHAIDAKLPILGTHDIMGVMIKEQLITIADADRIKLDWETLHRFKLSFDSFADILE